MNKKIVIWLLGSNGAGKTTQCKNLVDYFTTNKLCIEVSHKVSGKLVYCYTKYKKDGIAVLGRLGKNQCTGLDNVYSELGADGVKKSLEMALDDKEVKIILVECIFGTFSWYEKWVKSGLRKRFKLMFVHLELSLFDNFRRIQQRRAKKEGIENWKDVPLEDTVYKNVGNKNRETRVIYQKLAGVHEKSKTPLADHSIQLNALGNPEDLTDSILNELNRIL